MRRDEKLKVAVDIALYYFTINTMLTFLSSILSDSLFRSSRELIGNFMSNALWYAVLLVVILFLAVLSNVLRRKAQGIINIDNKSLHYVVVGILLIVSGFTSIPIHISIIITFSNIIFRVGSDISQIQNAQLVKAIYSHIVPIAIYTLQIGIGVYFASVNFNGNKHIEESF
jgi:hypothetical protein